MFDKMVRRIVRTGKAHSWLKPFALFSLLVLFGGAALAEWIVTQSARAWQAAGRIWTAFIQRLTARRERMAARRGTSEAKPFRPSHRPVARAAAVALAVCMVFTLMPQTAFAAEVQTGICEHHPVHTPECGYQEAEPGHPCEHEHTADCYTDELICSLEETTTETASGSDAGHKHTQGCYALDCPHDHGEHDGSCGYIAAVEGVPCGNVCELCAQPVDSGNSGNGIETVTLVAFDGLDEAVQHQSVQVGTPLEELVLPNSLKAAVYTTAPDTEAVVIDGVTWEPDSPYEGAAGSYAFTASATGYTCAEGVDWPVITIVVEEQPDPEPAAYDAALALFAALPAPAAVANMTDGEKDALAAQIGAATDALLALPDGDYDRFLSEHGDYMELVAALQDALTGGVETLADTPTPTVDGTNIFANGAEIKIVAGTTEGNTNILYDKNNDGTIGDTEYLKIGSTEPTADGYDLARHNIYGGSYNADVDGAAKIIMTGGEIEYLYGGGRAGFADADVKGAELILSGGLVGNSVFGGGNASSSGKTASVTGNTSITLSGDVGVRYYVYGGGNAKSSNTTATVTGNAAVTMTGGTAGGGDSSGSGVYGGGSGNSGATSTVGSASVEMTGGTAGAVYGGGWAGKDSQAKVIGAATVSLSGAAEVDNGVCGGGYIYENGKLTAASKTVTVGGGVKIGGSTAKGIVIDGGTASVANGVDSFVIDSDLTENAGVNVQLPAGYDITSNPTIATGAVTGDLEKIKLVGDGAEGKEAYFESNEIKVRAKTVVPAHTHAMSVDCSTVEGTRVDFDKALTAETTSISASGNYYLTEDVTIADKCLKITGAGVVINLCLNGHTLTAGNASSQVIQVVDGATLHLCDCQPDATNNTAITDPTTDQSVTVTGGLITGGKFPASNAFDSSTIGIIGAITGTDGEKHAALHLYGGTVAGNVSNNNTVEVMRGSFTLHGGRLAYNTSRNGGVCIWSNGNAVIVGGAIEHNHVTDPHNSGYTAVYLSGSDSALLTLSGQPVIRGNTRGTEKTPGNLYLGEAWVSSQFVGKTMLIGENFAPTEQIGIVTELEPTQDSPVPITGTNSADYSAYFKSDDPAYVIQNGEGNVVQLALPEAAKSTDATLSALAYKVGTDGQETPVPDFAADTAAYDVTLPYDTSATASIILSGTPNDRGASITENNGATLENGSGQATVTVTAEDGTTTKTYTVNFITAQPTSYTVAIDGGVTNGTVSASPTSAAAGTEVTLTVTPANGYELDALSVYKTGEAGTTVTVSNNKFTMPSYNVTVTATFKKTADQTAVESAKSIIEGGAYSVAQATANSADDVKTWLATTINNLSGMSATGITVQADSITVSDFTAAQADTTGSGGSNGSFKFTVSLSKNGAAATTTSKTGIITKTPYNPPQKSDAKEITSFVITGHVGTIFINQVKHTITVPMPAGTNVTSLTPTITVSDKASVNPASGTAQDFTSPVTYTVTAENGTTQTYTVTVTVAPTITTQTLPGGTVGTAYSHTLAADGTAPVTWSVSEGSLPDGLNLNIGTGVISGTPSTEGTSTFTVKAENSAGNDTRELSIRIDAPAPAVTGVTVSPATASIQKGNTKQFSAEVTGTNNPAQTVTWSLEGSHASGTGISNTGLLTVASDETQATLTVKAISTVDSTKSGTATVTVTDQTVTRYTLTVNGGNASGDYAQGTEITVTANTQANKRFKEWTASGITLNDKTANPVTIIMPANAVTLVATYDDLYAVTASNDGNGTATASPATAAQGDTVTITATANSGYQFKEWQAISGGVSLANANAASTSFTMPGAAVEVKAIFELQTTPPPTHYSLTVTGSYASATGEGSYSAGETVTIYAGSRSGYSFSGWTVASGNVSLANQYQSTTTFTMPAENVAVQANWSRNSSGGGDSDSGSGSGSSTPPTIVTPPETKPDAPVTAQTEIKAQSDGKGGAEVTVPKSTVDSAIQKAQEEAKRNGTQAGGIAVQVNVAADSQNVNSLTVNLPKATQEQIIDNKVQSFALALERPDITLSLSLASVQEINRQANADVQLTATRLTDTSNLSGEAKAVVGSRPLFQLTATYKGGANTITDFGRGSVTVAIPYQLQPGESAGGLYLVYIDGQGKPQFLMNSSYDAENEVLRGATTHFSLYAVGYKAPDAFSDIANHWAKEDIEFVAARSLMAGVGNGRFNPDGTMTRAMFVTALGRLAGVNPADYKSGTFTDVKADAYYAPYVEWAEKTGVVKGIGGGLFAPDQIVSRQEMAVIMANYAKAMGCKVPVNREAMTFTDNASIASWAADAVKAMQQAGVLMGKDGNRFDPSGSATRAEAAAVLHRYVELVIDRQTAQGLDVNDSGSAMLWENGKLVKSASRTVNSRTYAFNGYGEAALPVSDKKYRTHIVKKNEYFWSISRLYGCTMQEIMDLNGLKMGDVIHPGDVLKVPQA